MINARTAAVQKQQRSATPVSTKSRSKTFNIEEWENKAPLTDSELKSVADLQIACQERPLPSHLEASENHTSISRSSTPVARNVKGSPSRPGTPQIVAQRGRSSLATMYPQKPIDTLQQFYDWYSVIDRSISHNLETQFRNYLRNISEYLNICDGLEERTDNVQKEVNSMIEEWMSVEVDGRALKDASERLLSERDDIVQLTEALSERLLYFQELDHAIRLLNHPGDSLVLQAEFLDTVERIDVCIDFLRQHRHYRECEVYLLRFQQCLSRAMTLIRMFVVNTFKNLSADLSKRLTDKNISQTTQTHFLYTRFQTVATQLTPLIRELERRAAAHPEELSALLSECQNAYFGIRRNILGGRLIEDIKNLDPSGTELVELTRAGSSYLRQLCVDEFSLYKSFFSTGKESLYVYLESLCDYLYDDLRPRILHEARLNVLCDVCMVIQALIVLDMVDDDVRLSDSRAQKNYDDFGQLRISYLLQAILQDAQTRLVFKAQAVLQSDIKFYTPKSEDIDYPKKLINHISRKNVNNKNSVIQDNKSPRNIFQEIYLLEQDTWYPTLSKTVWLLNQLHDFIQPAIFRDIALEAIDVCRAGLITASEKITSKESEIADLTGLLFLIRHLFLLKKIFSVLDLASHTTGHDINNSSITSTLRDVLWTNSFMPPLLANSRNSYTQSTSISQNIDNDLRRACEQVIDLCASTVTLPLRSSLITEAQEKQVTGSKDSILAADDSFRTNLQKILLPTVAQLKLFLEDDGANSVIVSHVEDKIVEEYASFKQATLSAFGGEVTSAMFTSNDLRSKLRSIYNNNDVS